MTIRSTLLTTAVTFALAGSAFAEGCDKIVFSDVGWTDITATTAVASTIRARHTTFAAELRSAIRHASRTRSSVVTVMSVFMRRACMICPAMGIHRQGRNTSCLQSWQPGHATACMTADTDRARQRDAATTGLVWLRPRAGHHAAANRWTELRSATISKINLLNAQIRPQHATTRCRFRRPSPRSRASPRSYVVD